ncbi:hypothetical protein RS030_192880 [Cryptosporidium xiaoi]|uniref:Uncharacterized protein n=1 Tax=Cryptosporidium xiaoi TaxID=659607 RepID=A0AAV9XZW1_9CRYT
MVGNTILVPPRSAFRSREELCAFVSYKMRRATEMFTFKCSLYQRELKLYLPEPVPKHRRWIDTFDSESIVTIPISKIEKDEIELFRRYYPEDMDLDSMFPGDLLQRSFKKRISSLLTSLVNKIVFLLVLKHDTWYVHQEARDGLREYLVNNIWPKQPKMRLLYRDHVTTFVDTRIRHFRDSVGRYFRDLQANSKNSEFVNNLIVTCDYKQSELDDIISKALCEQKYYFEKESNTQVIKSIASVGNDKFEIIENKSTPKKCNSSENEGNDEIDKIVIRNVSEYKNLIQTNKLTTTDNFEISKNGNTETDNTSIFSRDGVSNNIKSIQKSVTSSNLELEKTDLTTYEDDLDIINNSSYKIINTIFDKMMSIDGVNKNDKQKKRDDCYKNFDQIKKMIKKRDLNKKCHDQEKLHCNTKCDRISDKNLFTVYDQYKLENINVINAGLSTEKRTGDPVIFNLQDTLNDEKDEYDFENEKEENEEYYREEEGIDDYSDGNFGDYDDDDDNHNGDEEDDDYSDCDHCGDKDRYDEHEESLQKDKNNNFKNLDFYESKKREKQIIEGKTNYNTKTINEFNEDGNLGYKVPLLKKKRVGMPEKAISNGNNDENNDENSKPFNVSTSSISSNITLSTDSVLSTSSLSLNSNLGLHINNETKSGSSPKESSVLNFCSLFQPLPSSVFSLYEKNMKLNQSVVYGNMDNVKSNIVYRNISNDNENFIEGNNNNLYGMISGTGYNFSSAIGSDNTSDVKSSSSDSIDNTSGGNTYYFNPANILNKIPLSACSNHIINSDPLINGGIQQLNQGVNFVHPYYYIHNYNYLISLLNNSHTSPNMNPNFNYSGFGLLPVSTSLTSPTPSSLTPSYSPSYYSIYPFGSHFTQPNIYNFNNYSNLLNSFSGHKANQRFKY